jgi:uncharacterized protein DUF3891
MLLRQDEAGTLAIGQPSHAWISGQLARAWGNEHFGSVEPFEEVCLAAEQHDVGWQMRDLEPSHNQETRLPYDFTQIPLDVHLELWTDGPRALLSQNRYAALLTSMHGWRLYQRRDLDRLPAHEAQAIRGYLAAQRSYQDDLIATLRDDPRMAPAVEEQRLERNSLLIWTWDYLSLALCLRWSPATAKGAPAASGKVDLEVTGDRDRGVLHIDPWPFAVSSLTVRCEGRRLNGQFDSELELREAFAQAPWETLELRLERT